MNIPAIKRNCVRKKRFEIVDDVHGGQWIDWYNANGYRAVVCYGWDEAREAIKDYMKGGNESGF